MACWQVQAESGLMHVLGLARSPSLHMYLICADVMHQLLLSLLACSMQAPFHQLRFLLFPAGEKVRGYMQCVVLYL